MVVNSPEQTVEMVDRAINQGDLEAVLNFYEAGAVVVTEPGKLARGKGELRRFFEHILASKPSARQIKTYVLEAEGVALFLSRWILTGSSPTNESSSKRFVATIVFRK